MFEHLLQSLPESLLACRALYDIESGGYHLPLRHENRPPRPGEVASWRKKFDRVQYDCIEPMAADLLYSVIVNTRARLVLETGTSRGFSTCHLAAGVRHAGAGLVVTVDLAPAPNPFFVGTALASSILPVRVNSLTLDLAPVLGEARFDFMFFDSLHTYDHLSRELAHYLPLLKVGGLFALHDTFVFDDLGLVVLWMMRNPAFETVSLPTHRRHAEKVRSPGVTLFRKVAPVAPGELLFPNLDGVAPGEQQWAEHPELIVARTGAFFTDPRYVSRGLHLGGARTPASPALLEPGTGRRENVDTIAPDLADRLAGWVARLA